MATFVKSATKIRTFHKFNLETGIELKFRLPLIIMGAALGDHILSIAALVQGVGGAFSCCKLIHSRFEPCLILCVVKRVIYC